MAMERATTNLRLALPFAKDGYGSPKPRSYPIVKRNDDATALMRTGHNLEMQLAV
jgi:hypothetical protein